MASVHGMNSVYASWPNEFISFILLSLVSLCAKRLSLWAKHRRPSAVLRPSSDKLTAPAMNGERSALMASPPRSGHSQSLWRHKTLDNPCSLLLYFLLYNKLATSKRSFNIMASYYNRRKRREHKDGLSGSCSTVCVECQPMALGLADRISTHIFFSFSSIPRPNYISSCGPGMMKR